MSEDLTNKLPVNHAEKLSRVLDAVQELTIRVDSLDRKVEELLDRTANVQRARRVPQRSFCRP